MGFNSGFKGLNTTVLGRAFCALAQKKRTTDTQINDYSKQSH